MSNESLMYLRTRLERIDRFGQFINSQGFSLTYNDEVSRKEGKGIFDYCVNNIEPNKRLTYVDAERDMWRPDNHFLFDFLTIPQWLQSLFSATRFTLTPIFHDSACRFRGLWRWDKASGRWSFYQMTRLQVDSMGRDMIGAEGGTAWERLKFFVGVRAYARCRYGMGDWRDKHDGRTSPRNVCL